MIAVTVLITSCQVSTLGGTHSGGHPQHERKHANREKPILRNPLAGMCGELIEHRSPPTDLRRHFFRVATRRSISARCHNFRYFEEISSVPQPDLKWDAVRGGIARELCASAVEETAPRPELMSVPTSSTE